MVTAFCHQLGWKNMEMLISQFQDRLHFGIHSELLELMKLPSLNGMRARTLFDAGFESISSIASADANVIENTLHKAVPFQSEKEREGDDSSDMKKRNKIKNIWITGCCGMTTKEAAENLILEARKYLELEIGVAEIKWVNTNSKESKLNKTDESKADADVKKDTDGMQTIDKITTIPEEVKTEPCSNQSENRNHLLEKPIEIGDCEDIYLVDIGIKDELNSEIKDEILDSSSINHEADSNIKENYFVRNNTTSNKSLKKEDITEELNKLQKGFTNNEISPSILKDDIVWDSLNFTEAASQNVSKLRTSDNIFSPNISLGESEDKSTISGINVNHMVSSKSVKDVSLFSSDGDNSSLFEESLPLDVIPSKILDIKKTQPQTSNMCKQETVADFLSINSNSILNAFKSSIIELDRDEDIKLVYEDENKMCENELETGFNISDVVEVEETQEINETAVKMIDYKSPYKRRAATKHNAPTAKKAKMAKSIMRPNSKVRAGLRSSVIKSSTIKINSASSKAFTLEVSKLKLKCFILRDRDILDTIHILENLNEIALYLDFETNGFSTSNEIIGSNILKQTNSDKDAKENEMNIKPLIKGIAAYLGEGSCVYLDLASLTEKLQTTKIKLSNVFMKCKIKMMSLKSNFVIIKKCFGIDLPLSCIDLSLAEWLIDSDERIPNIIYLVSITIAIKF